ncbi:MAG TPA: hypothetical protein VGL29_13420 [Blastocatellia bacterium]|jgi:hypothetical protein
MPPFSRTAPSVLLIVVLLILIDHQSAAQPTAKSATKQAGTARVTFQKAFVVDDRLSALRRDPDPQSTIIHRLRLGRVVFVIGAATRKSDQPKFWRIAVSRRTRGWIHESALAIPGHAGEDQRVIKLAESTKDGFDRIALCRIIIERFGRSTLVPRALLLLGEEADRAAQTLSQHTRRRLGEAGGELANASLRDYYMNDTGLDRYNKLGVLFDYNQSTSDYVYEGKAYRELVKRFPDTKEAKLARQHIEADKQKMAREQ